MQHKLYKPSKGDLAYSNAGDDISPFDEAILLRGVSDEYLAVLVQDNQAEGSGGFRALIEFELQRRAAVRTRDANFIALGGMAVAAISVIASVMG